MIINGKQIASQIYTEIADSARGLRLTIFTCQPNFETQKYLHLKMKKAQMLGIETRVVEFPADCSTEEIFQSIGIDSVSADGVVVQLPFPKHIDREKIITAIPKEKDVDVMMYDGKGNVLPPVTGAIAEIAKRHQVDFAGKNVVVLGEGLLVGRPAALWAVGQGANVTIINHLTENPDDILHTADIIISGAGVPNLITLDKIKDDVIIFDAGTSEDGGELCGDADPECAMKASLFTPVPGGIGPVTVAVLLRNLVNLN